jgi:hypothetical protein
MYDYCISMTKLSILAFYLRIFPDLKFKRSTYLCATVPATICQFTPVPYMWNSWTGETKGHCISVFVLTWMATSIHILLDIIIILLPILPVMKLILSRKKNRFRSSPCLASTCCIAPLFLRHLLHRPLIVMQYLW